MNIDTVVNFPFPTPPDRQALQKAEASLTHLGAIDASGRITELGLAMSNFPLSPRFSRMLVGGRQHGCLPYVIAVVATLSVGDPFLNEESIPAESPDDETNKELNAQLIVPEDSRSTRRKAYFQARQVCADILLEMKSHGVSDARRFRRLDE